MSLSSETLAEPSDTFKSMAEEVGISQMQPDADPHSTIPYMPNMVAGALVTDPQQEPLSPCGSEHAEGAKDLAALTQLTSVQIGDGNSIGAEDTSLVLQLLLQRVHSIESKLDSLIGSAVKSIPSERLGKRIEAAADTASDTALFDETVLRKEYDSITLADAAKLKRPISGTVVRWRSEAGFGFISVHGLDVFAHTKAMQC